MAAPGPAGLPDLTRRRAGGLALDPRKRMLEEGRYASIGEMAAAERIERGYLGSVLGLTLLAPDIVEAILDGRQTTDLGLPRLVDAVPADWSGQRQALLGAGDAG